MQYLVPEHLCIGFTLGDVQVAYPGNGNDPESMCNRTVQNM